MYCQLVLTFLQDFFMTGADLKVSLTFDELTDFTPNASVFYGFHKFSDCFYMCIGLVCSCHG